MIELESIEHDYIRILKSQSYKQMPGGGGGGGGCKVRSFGNFSQGFLIYFSGCISYAGVRVCLHAYLPSTDRVSFTDGSVHFWYLTKKQCKNKERILSEASPIYTLLNQDVCAFSIYLFLVGNLTN